LCVEATDVSQSLSQRCSRQVPTIIGATVGGRGDATLRERRGLARAPTRQASTRPLKGEPLPTGLKIGYVTSRFPKLTETFVLYEILGLERSGVEVEFYPLLRERAALVHPEAVPVVNRAHFLPFLSWAILLSQLHFLRRRPRAYLGALRALVQGTWGSANYLIGGIGIFPKVAHAARELEEKGVEHVHCSFSSHPAVAGFLIHRLTGIPYSFTAQGSDLHVDRHMLSEKLAEAAFVVAISGYNRDLILHECGDRWRDKIVVIHSGIESDFFKARASRRPDGPFRILCIGTLHEVKGQTYLIDACRLLSEAGVELSCQLVGDGKDRAALERQIADAGLEERVRLEGQRTRGQVAELLRAADVLVAPSVPTKQGKREGIPIVLMEALATGVPVLASDISGIPELVEDGRTGLLAPPRDTEALARALRRLHDEPKLRRQLGLAGREKVVREFDAHANAGRLASQIAIRSTRRD
jgi:colanic acid/amylovoran biosynthesis glycosyltransferase